MMGKPQGVWQKKKGEGGKGGKEVGNAASSATKM